MKELSFSLVFMLAGNMPKYDNFPILQRVTQDSKKTNEMSFKVCENDQQDQGQLLNWV